MKFSSEVKTFHALGDKRRLEIYEFVRVAGKRGIRPAELLNEISIKLHQLSNQLRILRDAGLVSRRIEGAAYYYLPKSSVLNPLFPVLEVGDE